MYGARQSSAVRRSPVERGRGERHGCNGKPGTAHPGGAIQSLRARSSDRRANVVGSRHEPDAGSDSCHESSDNADGERRDEEREQVSQHDRAERTHRQRSRASLVDEPPAWDL
jgi:hypothetical protein